MFNWDIHRKLSPVCVNDVAAVLKSLFFFFTGRFTEGSEGQVRVPVCLEFPEVLGAPKQGSNLEGFLPIPAGRLRGVGRLEKVAGRL